MTKIALVTGASRGLGRNTALSIARHGGDVIVTYQSRVEDAQAVVSEIEALGRKAVALKLDTGYVATFPDFAERLRAALGDEILFGAGEAGEPIDDRKAGALSVLGHENAEGHVAVEGFGCVPENALRAAERSVLFSEVHWIGSSWGGDRLNTHWLSSRP